VAPVTGILLLGYLARGRPDSAHSRDRK
jgi:hypothetical protein